MQTDSLKKLLHLRIKKRKLFIMSEQRQIIDLDLLEQSLEIWYIINSQCSDKIMIDIQSFDLLDAKWRFHDSCEIVLMRFSWLFTKHHNFGCSPFSSFSDKLLFFACTIFNDIMKQACLHKRRRKTKRHSR